MPNAFDQNAVYLQSGSPETEHRAADGYSGGQLGSRFTVRDNADSKKGKSYQLVQNDSVLAVLPSTGAVAWWKDRANFLVTTDVTGAGRGNVAGVYRCASAINEIVCIQRKGPSTVLIVDAPTAAPSALGLIVIPSATAAKADCLAAGTAASYPALGKSEGTQDGTTKLAAVALNLDDDTP